MSTDSDDIPMNTKLIPKKQKKKSYFSSKYGKISTKSSSENNNSDDNNDQVNDGQQASSSMNTFPGRDGLVFTNSDFNITYRDIGSKKQTKFDYENYNANSNLNQKKANHKN